jgi:hypothetical protein
MPSTVIRAAHYDVDRGELDIVFTTGRRYIYHDVPPEAADRFRAAFSKGRHFNARIRDHYPFTEITEQAEPLRKQEAQAAGRDRSSAPARRRSAR